MAPATTLAEAERRLVIETLIRCRGNRTHAAKMLGISVRTVRNRIAEYRRIGVCLPIYRDVVWSDWPDGAFSRRRPGWTDGAGGSDGLNRTVPALPGRRFGTSHARIRRRVPSASFRGRVAEAGMTPRRVRSPRRPTPQISVRRNR